MRVFPSSIFLLIGLVGISAALLFISGSNDGNESGEVSAEGRVSFTTGILGTSNRSNLSVCVDGVGGHAVAAPEVAMVRRALVEGLTSVSDVYQRATDYRDGAEVSAGCPAHTAALTVAELAAWEASGDASADDIPGSPINVRGPDTPSSHLLFVYIIPSDVYGRVFGAEAEWAKGAAEMLCGGHSCAQVTTALYVSPSIDPAELSAGLLSGIGYGEPEVDPPMSPEERNERTRQGLENAGLSPSEIDEFFERACSVVPDACPTPLR